MSTRTTTGVTHYHIQKKRRAELIEEWRRYQKTVVRCENVPICDTARGMRRGVYAGMDGDNPTRTIDATAHEIDPGCVSTIHRHSWDAMMLCVGGWAWTEIDGQRIEWGPGDCLHLPAWAWHRHGNDGAETARFMSFSCEPLLNTMGMSIQEEAGYTPICELAPRPSFTTHIEGDDSYARRVRRLGREQQRRRNGRLHTSWNDVELLPTPRGTRTSFLLDRAIGYQASGLSMAIFEMAPGRGQSMHRHPGEAWLYVLEGHGHSFLGAEPGVGENHSWKKGDIIVVDHFLWHQHFNDDPKRTAKVVRIHMFDSLLETMRVLTDPLVLFEEPPNAIRDAQAGDPATVDWPAVARPTWP